MTETRPPKPRFCSKMKMILPKGENVAHTGCFTQTATKEIDTVSDLNEPAEKQKKI